MTRELFLLVCSLVVGSFLECSKSHCLGPKSHGFSEKVFETSRFEDFRGWKVSVTICHGVCQPCLMLCLSSQG